MSNINGTELKKKWVPNEFGMLIEEEDKLEMREKMRRWEWKEYFHEEEISKEDYISEQRDFQRSLNGHMG